MSSHLNKSLTFHYSMSLPRCLVSSAPFHHHPLAMSLPFGHCVPTTSLQFRYHTIRISSPCHRHAIIYQVTTMSLPRRSHVMTMYPEHRILIPIKKLPSFQIEGGPRHFAKPYLDAGLLFKALDRHSALITGMKAADLVWLKTCMPPTWPETYHNYTQA